MCGIAGYVLRGGEVRPLPDLERMTRLLAHRGPDDEGYHRDPGCGLGMRRLAIIDLTAGHQPMTNETGTVWVVFNGEIYNYRELREELVGAGHRFATQSDTEVLVHGYEQWGDDLPLRLRGMFAFAVRDLERRRTVVVRDHFGIKPLYWAEAGGAVVFASEIKSLLAWPRLSRELDRAALDQYLSFLYVPDPRTIFRDVRALPPAHSLVIDEAGVRVRRYWQFRPQLGRYRSPAEACAAVRAVFEDSVRAQMVADVPLGVFVSGGIDSTGILAMMTRHATSRVQSFTIGFGARERNWDELEPARRVARHFDTEHHEFRIEPDVVELLPRAVRHFDQPFANPTAVILYLLAGETRRHVKVALAGTGGDELFAGYPRYLGMQVYRRWRLLPEPLRRAAATLARRLARDATDGRLGPQRARRFLEGGAGGWDDCYVRLMAVLDQERKRSLYTPDLAAATAAEDSAAFLRAHLTGVAGIAEPERLMGADLATYLPGNQLAYGDRMSMAQSLEVRVPFVDQRLVDVAGAIPLAWKTPRLRTKGLLRRALAGELPREILAAPKRGLNLPIALWFRGPLLGWVRSLLAPERLRRRGLLRPEAVAAVVGEHAAGRRDHSLFLWALLVLEVWLQEYASADVPVERAAVERRTVGG
jgi:asparagine synthase (glutamine-hydrolysing)